MTMRPPRALAAALLAAPLSAAPLAAQGTVSAQVCTDKACDRPKKHPFTVPTT